MAEEKPKNEEPVMIHKPPVQPVKKRDANCGEIIHK